MRMVLVTRDDLEHRYVAGVLTQAFPESLHAIVLSAAGRIPLRSRVRRYLRRYGIGQILSRVLNRMYARVTKQRARRTRALSDQLADLSEGGVFPREDLTHRVTSLNREDSVALVRELEPDVLLVYGTEILRPPIIGTAKRLVLNLHTGISPRYRGADSVFWALHNGEPEWIGATVHELDVGIDSGPILATARPDIDPQDDEHSLFAKCVAVGADIYVRTIRDVMADTASRTRQALGEGREYRSVERTVRAELRVWGLLRRGLLARRA